MFFSRKRDSDLSKSSTQNKSIDMDSVVNNLIQKFDQEKQSVINQALSIENFFNKEWDEYLLSWNITARSITEREDDIKNGIPLSGGALPVEVREVLVALQNKYQQECKLLRNNHEQALRDEDEIEEKLWEFEHRTLEEMAEKETRRYIKKIKKDTSSSLDNALNHAEDNKNKWSSNLNEATSYMIRCKNCGAARLHTDQYDNCKFCGSDLFEKIEK